MWQTIQPVNIFKGERFKLVGENHLTFTALDEPVVVATDKGDVVRIRCRTSGTNAVRNLKLPYDSFVSSRVVAR